MEQITTFLAMGKYGLYVWPAYILTAVIMLSLLITTLHRLRRNQAELEELQSLYGGGRPARGEAPSGDSAKEGERARS